MYILGMTRKQKLSRSKTKKVYYTS